MKIFLSHASEDKSLVSSIQSHLPKHINAWLDVDELGLGMKFPDQIKREITEDSDFVIVFLGNNALRSKWVERELNWALERESEIQRVFVLPVLLDNIWPHVTNKHPALEDRLYLEGSDHSDAGLTLTAEKLGDYLFAQLSRNIGALKTTPPRQFVNELTEDLTHYKEIAYKLHATMGDTLAVLSTNQQAFDNIARVVNEYNVFTEKFITRLPNHCENVQKRWGQNLADECANMIHFIEKDVYRGQVYALNEVREAINQCSTGDKPSHAEIEKLNHKKDQLLADVDQALVSMTRTTTHFLSRLEREI